MNPLTIKLNELLQLGGIVKQEVDVTMPDLRVLRIHHDGTEEFERYATTFEEETHPMDAHDIPVQPEE